MKFLVYLAGPITGLSFGDCTDWREYVHNEVSSKILTMSPMRGKQFLSERAKAGLISGSYEDSPLASYKGINTRDYFDVQRTDAIFVNFLGAKTVSIGTVMEIAWARAFSKPVVCVMEEENIHRHTMLEYACGYIVPTLEEGIAVLEAVLLTDVDIKQVA